jgi:hypothetical protein
VAIALGAGVLAMFITMGLAPIFDTTPTDPVVTAPRPAPQQGPLVSTDLSEVKEAFALTEPVLVDTSSVRPDTRSPAVVLLNEDGSMLASTTYTVPFDQSWSQEDTNMITSLSVKLGYVTMGTNPNDRVFVVKALQPFIFADAPEKVYAVTLEAKTYSLTTARAQALMRTFK